MKIVYREGDGEQPERSVRAFHAVQGPAGYVYEPADLVASDPLTRQMVLRDMERQWKELFARYEQFEEFLEMVTADVEVVTA